VAFVEEFGPIKQQGLLKDLYLKPMQNGDQYIGSLVNGLPHGFGLYQWTSVG
jgi:hypothetical protein